MLALFLWHCAVSTFIWKANLYRLHTKLMWVYVYRSVNFVVLRVSCDKVCLGFHVFLSSPLQDDCMDAIPCLGSYVASSVHLLISGLGHWKNCMNQIYVCRANPFVWMN